MKRTTDATVNRSLIAPPPSSSGGDAPLPLLAAVANSANGGHATDDSAIDNGVKHDDDDEDDLYRIVNHWGNPEEVVDEARPFISGVTAAAAAKKKATNVQRKREQVTCSGAVDSTAADVDHPPPSSASSALLPSSTPPPPLLVAIGQYINEGDLSLVATNLSEGATYVDSSVKVTAKDVASCVAAERITTRVGPNWGGEGGGSSQSSSASSSSSSEEEDSDYNGEEESSDNSNNNKRHRHTKSSNSKKKRPQHTQKEQRRKLADLAKKQLGREQRLHSNTLNLAYTDDPTLFRPIGAIFARRCIPLDICKTAAALLERAATRKNRRQMTNGGNAPPETGIVGYYDYGNNPTQHKCRETEFTRHNLPHFAYSCEPLIKALDMVYATFAPNHYHLQMQTIPESYKLFGTCFSTITVNKNFRTAAHVDRGDFKAGLGVVAVLEGSGFRGCYLAIPKLNLAFDMEVGDAVLFDTAHLHGNTEVYVQVSEEELAAITARVAACSEAWRAIGRTTEADFAEYKRERMARAEEEEARRRASRDHPSSSTLYSAPPPPPAVTSTTFPADVPFTPNIVRRRGNRVYIEVPFGYVEDVAGGDGDYHHHDADGGNDDANSKSTPPPPTLTPPALLAKLLYPLWKRISIVAYLRSGLATPICWRDRAERFQTAQRMAALQRDAAAVSERGEEGTKSGAEEGAHNHPQTDGDISELGNGVVDLAALHRLPEKPSTATLLSAYVNAPLSGAAVSAEAYSNRMRTTTATPQKPSRRRGVKNTNNKDDDENEDGVDDGGDDDDDDDDAAPPATVTFNTSSHMYVPAAIAQQLTRTQSEALVFAAGKLAYPTRRAVHTVTLDSDGGSDDDGDDKDGNNGRRGAFTPTSSPSHSLHTTPRKKKKKRIEGRGGNSSSSSTTPIKGGGGVDADADAEVQHHSPSSSSSFTQSVSGCILALPMGQGKTLIGLIAAFNHFRQWPREDVLVVAPKAVLSHWCTEAAKWAQPPFCLRLPFIVSASEDGDAFHFEQSIMRYNAHVSDVERKGKGKGGRKRRGDRRRRGGGGGGGHHNSHHPSSSTAAASSSSTATAPSLPPPPPPTRVGHLFIVNFEKVGVLRRRCPLLRPGLILIDEGHRIGNYQGPVSLAHHHERQRGGSNKNGGGGSGQKAVGRGSAKSCGGKKKTKRVASKKNDDDEDDESSLSDTSSSEEDGDGDGDDAVDVDVDEEAQQRAARRAAAQCLPSLCAMTATRFGGQRRRAIIFTGTPLQNDANELYRLVEFISPHVALTLPLSAFQQKIAPIDAYLHCVSAGDVAMAQRVNAEEAGRHYTTQSNVADDDDDANDDVANGAATTVAPQQRLQGIQETRLFTEAVAAQQFVLEWLRGFMYRKPFEGEEESGGGGRRGTNNHHDEHRQLQSQTPPPRQQQFAPLYKTRDVIVVCNLSYTQQCLVDKYRFYGKGGAGRGHDDNDDGAALKDESDGLQMLLSANEHRPYHLTAHPATLIGFTGGGGLAGRGARGSRGGEEEDSSSADRPAAPLFDVVDAKKKGEGGGECAEMDEHCYMVSLMERLTRKHDAAQLLSMSTAVPLRKAAAMSSTAMGAAASPPPPPLPSRSPLNNRRSRTNGTDEEERSTTGVGTVGGGDGRREGSREGAAVAASEEEGERRPIAMTAEEALARTYQTLFGGGEAGSIGSGSSSTIRHNGGAAISSSPTSTSPSSSSPRATNKRASSPISPSTARQHQHQPLFHHFLRDSGKLLVAACLIANAAVARREKIVVLTQYVGVQRLLWDVLAAMGIRCAAVSGQDSCAARDASLGAFRGDGGVVQTEIENASKSKTNSSTNNNTSPSSSQQGCNVLIITSRTGSFGLDLTCANHLILFDSWWNPQMDAQATARVNRRNQTKDVFIYRLATRHEERIVLRLHTKKLLLFDWIVNGRALIQNQQIQQLQQHPHEGGNSERECVIGRKRQREEEDAAADAKSHRHDDGAQMKKEQQQGASSVPWVEGMGSAIPPPRRNLSSLSLSPSELACGDHSGGDDRLSSSRLFWEALMTVPLNGRRMTEREEEEEAYSRHQHDQYCGLANSSSSYSAAAASASSATFPAAAEALPSPLSPNSPRGMLSACGAAAAPSFSSPTHGGGIHNHTQRSIAAADGGGGSGGMVPSTLLLLARHGLPAISHVRHYHNGPQ